MVGIISGLVSAAGSLFSGQAQAAADKYNAAVYTRDATQSQINAKVSAGMQEQQIARKTSETRAQFGASGTNVDQSTSPLQVMRDEAQQGELARRLTIFQGQQTSRKYNEAAALERQQASAALDASWWQAGSTVLTTADKALNNAFPATMAAMGG